MPEGGARLSVVLATDTYETIRPVVDRLRRQAIARDLEVVLAGPRTLRQEVERVASGEFAAVQVVDTGSATPLPAARAEGVRRASAPIVFIGETHTYPHPGWAEALLRAFEQPWAAVVPAVDNANPRGAVSWAAYLSDYGKWGYDRPAGEIQDPLLYNTAYRRAVLCDLRDGLERALDFNTESLWPTLRACGHRAWFEPAARIDHLNVGRPGPFFTEKLAAGLLVGASRARRWPWHRRLLYLLAAPAIACVLTMRPLADARRIARTQRLPRGTRVWIAAGALCKAAGEAIGYAIGAPWFAEARMAEIELHKVRYAASGAR
jgi:hypothetical protein